MIWYIRSSNPHSPLWVRYYYYFKFIAEEIIPTVRLSDLPKDTQLKIVEVKLNPGSPYDNLLPHYTVHVLRTQQICVFSKSQRADSCLYVIILSGHSTYIVYWLGQTKTWERLLFLCIFLSTLTNSDLFFSGDKRSTVYMSQKIVIY